MVVCFYLEKIAIACERARLPHIWGLPVGLVGEKSLLKVVSDDAEARGIRPGQSVSGAQSLCKDLITLPYERPLYQDAMPPIWNIFALESSCVEPVSPEICYWETNLPDFFTRVQEVVSAVEARIGVTVRAGVSRTKFTAYRAAISHPGSGATYVPPDHAAEFVASTPLDAIPGLEPKVLDQLRRLGITLLADAAAIPLTRYPKRLTEIGYRLHRLAGGDDGERVHALWPPRASGQHTIFDDEVTLLPILENSLSRLATDIALELRAHQEFCRTLRLDIELAAGGFVTESEHLTHPIAAPESLISAAKRLLQRLHIKDPVISIVLEAGALGAGSGVQQSLFDSHGNAFPQDNGRRLSTTIDHLRKRFGASSVITLDFLYAPRAVNLWTCSLGKQINESVQVQTGPSGEPLRFIRKQCRFDVEFIQDRWRESGWFWGSYHERAVYRVGTVPGGLWEVEKEGSQWRLRAIAD